MTEIVLPKGWSSDALETLLIHVIGGDWGQDSKFDDPDYIEVFCIRGSEFRHWEQHRGSTASLRKIKITSLKTRQLEVGDILIEISGGGPDQPVGRTVLIDERVINQFGVKPFVCTNFLRLARPSRFINSMYLNCYLRSFYLSGEVINYQGGSNNLRNLKFKEYSQISIPVPSFAEQQQIAAKLDELLAQVDSIKTRLDTIPKILKRFRQSVLAEAVSGKLTEDWRSENEYAAVTNIGEKCFEERTLVFKKAKKPIKLEETPKLGLPRTWAWISIDEICLKITDGTHHSPKSFPSGDYMYVTSKNVREGYINLSNISFVDQKTHSEIYSRCDVVKGDVLYVKDGANTGLSCVNNISEQVSLLSSVGVLRPTKLIAAKYLELYLNSPIGRRLMLNMIGGTAIMRLTLTKIMKSPLSLPPVEEQTEIVIQVEQLFAYADQIEQRVKDAQARVNQLTQSILAKAFRGELTADWRAQNPELISGENSAEVLLANIQNESKKLNKSRKLI